MAAEERDDWEPETEEEEEGDEASRQQGSEVSEADRKLLAAVKGSGMTGEELVARARAHAEGERNRKPPAAAAEEEDPDRMVTAGEARVQAERVADVRTRQAMNRAAIDEAIDHAIDDDPKFAALAAEDDELRQLVELHVGRSLASNPAIGSWSPAQFKANARKLAAEAIAKQRARAAKLGAAEVESSEEPEELDRRLSASRETGDSGRGGAGAGKSASGRKVANDEERGSDEDDIPFGDREVDWAKLGRDNAAKTKKAVDKTLRRQAAGA